MIKTKQPGANPNDQNSTLKKTWRKNAGFTLIELIVVMAIIAILVLLAAPRFLDKTQQAKDTKITNDIKVVEGLVEEYLIKHDKLDSTWTEKTPLAGDNLYDTTGPLGSAGIIEAGPYRLLTDEILAPANTQLDGKFYGNDKGKVYYEEISGPKVEAIIPDGIGSLVVWDPQTTLPEGEKNLAGLWTFSNIGPDGKFLLHLPTESSGLDNDTFYYKGWHNNYYNVYWESAVEYQSVSPEDIGKIEANNVSLVAENFTSVSTDKIRYKINLGRWDHWLPTDTSYVLDVNPVMYLEISNPVFDMDDWSATATITFLNGKNEVINTMAVLTNELEGEDLDGDGNYEPTSIAFKWEAEEIASSFSNFKLYSPWTDPKFDLVTVENK